MTEPMRSRWLRCGRLWRIIWQLLGSPRLTAGLLLALGLCTALGTLFPQQPSQVDPTVWMKMVQQRYGGLADIYAGLGLFDIYHTHLFIALAIALVINTLVCTVRRATSIWHSAQQAPRVVQPDDFYHRMACRQALKLPPSVPALEIVQSVLRRHRYRVIVVLRGASHYLYGERYPWARWGTLVTHSAIVLLTTALMLRGMLAWRESGVQLAPGETYTVRHNPLWAIRLERLSGPPSEAGLPLTPQAHVTLLARGQPVAEHMVAINSPLSHRGLKVYLVSFTQQQTSVAVDIVHDPSFLPVIISAVLMVGGLSCTFAFSSRRLWIKIIPGSMWVAGRTARDPLGLEGHLRQLTREVRAQLTERGGE